MILSCIIAFNVSIISDYIVQVWTSYSLLQSIMSVSGTSSTRKRKRGIQWEDVILSLDDITIDKTRLKTDLTEFVTDVSKFLDLSPKAQEIACEHCGITGWKDRLIYSCY